MFVGLTFYVCMKYFNISIVKSSISCLIYVSYFWYIVQYKLESIAQAAFSDQFQD